MNGKIKWIKESGGTKPPHGFIMGDDGVRYYFNGKLLSDGYDMSDFREGESVTFNPAPPQFDAANPQATNVKSLNAAAKFYKPGFSKSLDLDRVERTLKRGSGEMEVLRKLKELLYIPYVSSHDMGHNSVFPFCSKSDACLLLNFFPAMVPIVKPQGSSSLQCSHRYPYGKI